MRQSCRTGLILGATMVAASLLAGVANASVQTVNPGDLARGANVKKLYADGAFIYPRTGAPVPMPPPTGAWSDYRRLLGGRALTGWVVWEHQLVGMPDGEVTMSDQLFRIRPGGHRRVIYTHSIPIPDTEGHEYEFWSGLSEDGKRTAAMLSDYGEGRLIVRTLAGEVVGRVSEVNAVGSFSGPRVAYFHNSHAYLWTPGHKPRRVTGRRAACVDLKHNVMFAETPDHRFGPTSLSHPGPVRWSAGFHPIRLSPNGSRVVGFKASTSQGPLLRPTVQMRRMSDGKVLASFRVDDPGQDLVWESNDAVLYPDHDWSRRTNNAVIVRCRISGRCVRASSWFDDSGQFSFPHTYPTD
jgi:hypothetical protein